MAPRRCTGPRIVSIASWSIALLKKGARANVVNRYGASPLARGGARGQSGAGRHAARGGRRRQRGQRGRQTALMLAARTGNVAVAELLVKARRRRQPARTVQGTVRGDVGGGREPSGDGGVPGVARAPTSRSAPRPPTGRRRSAASRACSTGPIGGLTPLLYAARAGCLACVQTMVEAGADKDRPNPDGMTPMIMALDNGAPAVAQYLLDRGANPHTWDWWGRTPLYVAVTMRGGHGQPCRARGRQSRWRSSRHCSRPA